MENFPLSVTIEDCLVLGWENGERRDFAIWGKEKCREEMRFEFLIFRIGRE